MRTRRTFPKFEKKAPPADYSRPQEGDIVFWKGEYWEVEGTYLGKRLNAADVRVYNLVTQGDVIWEGYRHRASTSDIGALTILTPQWSWV